ncbi:MAG TPA: microviridin/marinostatin family tricyclic proteinase inhibitor [Myxococcaceae bacterium]|nr:microviridin/marinostatin family tricyclic proteinase inhibitor [Myxococcaceae bacterium]
MKVKKKKEVPFFARFLEGQELKRVKGSITTLKYPSDYDEYVTMKYPSDDDEAPTE